MIHILFSASALSNFQETFQNGMSGWIQSDWKGKEVMGAWSVSETGLMTTEDARFYAISKKFDTKMSSQGADLYVQYSVNQSQAVDCGGAYLKLFPATVKQEELKGGENEDVYNIMFGPDFCGNEKKSHLIFHHKGKNYENKQRLEATNDQKLHLYTFALFQNGTYAYWLDDALSKQGELRTDYDFLPPRQIPDPTVSKPKDWVDTPSIPDPNDKKPDNWDDIPKTIPDPDASKPDDWDDEDDGEWEPPQIPNQDYKGEWKANMIPNPEYKGEWVHPQIENPDYADDESIAKYDDLSIVAFELWQVKSGTSFNSIVVTNDAKDIEKGFEAYQKKIKSSSVVENEIGKEEL